MPPKFPSSPKQSSKAPNENETPEAKKSTTGDRFLTRRVGYYIFLFRLVISVLLVKGSDVPDEWWQSTEVAYHYVYRKGHLPLEWRADTAIRSFVYPAPFALAFSLLKFLEIDSTFLIWLAPRLITAAIATGVDINTYRIAKFFDTSPDNDGVTVGKLALIFSVVHWFTGFITARTESNVLEALVFLLVIQQAQYIPFLIVAGFGCAVRPTAAVLFFPSAVAHWLHGAQRFGFKAVVFIATSTIVVGGVWLLAVASIDRLFYGFWTCTPWNFLVYNVLEGRSAFYGSHPWHWYITAALPAISMPYTPLLALLFFPSTWAIDVPMKITAKLVMCCATTLFAVSAYSGVEHKEMRFLYPLVPVLIAMAAFIFLHHPFIHQTTQRPKGLLKAMGLFNVLLLLFLGVTYRRGPLDVMAELRFYPSPITSIDVLTSCYNLPGLSYAHNAVGSLRGLDCTLSLSRASDGTLSVKKVTENDLFVGDPVAFVEWVYGGTAPRNKTLLTLLNATVPGASWPVPEALILYASTAEALKPFLAKHGFASQRSIFHTLVLLESDEDYWIELWQRNLTSAEHKRKKKRGN
jgi:phosphatidylinositol glycan class B